MESLDRRAFVGTVLAGGAVLAAMKVRAADTPTLRAPTDRVPLGKSGVTASFVGMGTGVHGWNHSSDATRMGRDKFLAVMHHAYDSGITFFDVADLYGTHPFLAEFLRTVPRDKVTIQSKIWWSRGGMPHPTTDATEAVKRFLTEIGTDHLDSVLLHCTTSGQWTTELAPMMEQLEACKQQGLVRSHGTSCHSFSALQASAASPWVDIQFARVNHKGREALMDGTADDIAAHLKSMRDAGKGVVGMKIYGEGRFRSPEEREKSLRFVLDKQCVDAMVIGFERNEEIDETLGTLSRLLKG
jgi:aryl-alcohol dehydrogenase-like predicted oxidoreductase